jgi:hypothetical protein
MEVAYELLLVLHFLGMASLVGGWLVQLRARGERYVNSAMVHGVLTQLVTGVLLVGLAEGVDSLEPELGEPAPTDTARRPLSADRSDVDRQRGRGRLLELTASSVRRGRRVVYAS